VRLALPEGDNFERCAIEVWVKFRDEEALQRLSSHRQSGGERSVATILYLIAIQARDPTLP
jgi:chromosome segregation ATPase